MTTLHMDVELAKGTVTTMKTSYEELVNTTSAMNGSVDNLLQGNWQGNSATQFEGLYAEWRGTMDGILQQLSEHAAQLENEIASWEAAAASLGG